MAVVVAVVVVVVMIGFVVLARLVSAPVLLLLPSCWGWLCRVLCGVVGVSRKKIAAVDDVAEGQNSKSIRVPRIWFHKSCTIAQMCLVGMLIAVLCVCLIACLLGLSFLSSTLIPLGFVVSKPCRTMTTIPFVLLWNAHTWICVHKHTTHIGSYSNSCWTGHADSDGGWYLRSQTRLSLRRCQSQPIRREFQPT